MKEDGHPTSPIKKPSKYRSRHVKLLVNETGVLVKPSMDMAASEFWNSETEEYVYAKEGTRR